ncbi:MAG: class I SAM-dependent methyltransferase [Oscillospiraceae bacterium]|nr:class I SAM-dependent methyltransferase [Oscillospiraceae bacterium]
MNAHPGGEAHTRRMLELAALPEGARILDLGAGAGGTVSLLRELGYAAEGIDLAPRSDVVTTGDLLHTVFPGSSFDAVLSQCSFYVAGDIPAALRESWRLLKTEGRLLWSDVFFEEPRPLLEKAGFELLCAEDMTPIWKEYYIEALWRGTADCRVPRGRCSYWLLIGRKV